MNLDHLEMRVLELEKMVQALLKDIRTMKADSDDAFWQEASQTSLKRIWDNKADDIYAPLDISIKKSE